MRIKLFVIPLFALIAAVIMLPPHPCCATELSIPEIKGNAGQTIDIPIMIDTVDNLAGVKIVHSIR